MTAESGSTETSLFDQQRSRDMAVLALLALLKVFINLLFLDNYGYHHDELYFIACGDHLSFGYVDHSPWVPWMARLSTDLFGDSLYALRIFPVLAGAAAVFLSGLIVREMGGRLFAQVLAAAAMIAAPAYLRMASMLCIPGFEVFFWTLAWYVLVLILKYDRPKLWLLFGLVTGLGLMNKPTMLLMGAALAVGLVLTQHRKHLKSPWLYAGGVVAGVVFLPNIIWQIQHDWATFRFVRNLNEEVMQSISTPDFLLGQILYMGPVNALLWLAGLGFLLFSKSLRPFRIFGVMFLFIAIVLILIKSKIYYLAPAYPILFAAGAMCIQQWTESSKKAWLQPAAFAAIVAGGLWMAPLGLPMLPIATAEKYIVAATGGVVDPNMAFEITGDWHGQYGWENQVATAAKVFDSLPPEEQAECVIIVNSYGQAGAIDFLGPAHGLPYALSNHLTYYLWGPGERSGKVAIAYGLSKETLEQFYTRVEQAAIIGRVPEDHPEKTDMPVYVCREPKMSLEDAWNSIEMDL